MMDVESPFGNTSFELDAQSPTGAGFSYEDAVTIINKGLEMELAKIPKGFTPIDFSSNNFHGKIPKELGLLRALIVLNLSNNAVSGHIPSSFGNLQQLESLDLSRNHLNGEIPVSLSNLNFLQYSTYHKINFLGGSPRVIKFRHFLQILFKVMKAYAAFL
nr:receptor-like protein 33 [Ziziphus jujuba var. spinosa]